MHQHELRVLIVDDSEDDALLMERALRRESYTVISERVATAAALMLALIPERRWDLITCDSGVPGLDASRVIALARQALPRVPVLLVSGRQPSELVLELEMANAFLSKRQLNDLPAMIRALLILS
jgi:CheY-like chemotaxis protein